MPKRRRDYKAEYQRRKQRYQQQYGVNYNEYRYWKRKASRLGVPSEDFDYMAKRSDRFLDWEGMKDLIRKRERSPWGNRSLQGAEAQEFIDEFYSITPSETGFDIDRIPDDVIDQWMGWGTP